MRVYLDDSLPLHGWTMLSLRPRGQHAGLRAAAARAGARTLALSPCAIEARDDRDTGAALRQALAADIVLFTSPNAVCCAAALQWLKLRQRQVVLAVGSGTQDALRHHGISADAPARMDSEGLLAMPALAAVAGRKVGLVCGVGGRDLLAPTLRRRGADLLRADIYRRVPVIFPARAQRGLAAALAAPERVVLALSSAEALHTLLAQTPPGARTRLAKIAVVAASARLAQAARDAGFGRIAIASSARAAALLHAAVDAFV